MKQFVAAQGDVLLVACEAIPPNATPVAPEGDRVVLAHGEATGHHHSFRHRPEVTLFRDTSGSSYLRVDAEPAALEHQEHSTITVPPGLFQVLRQRTMHAGMARRVAD